MLFENFAVHPHRRGMAMASVTGSMNRIWPKWFRITFKTRCTGSTASNAFFFSCGAHSESFWPSHEKTWYPAAANEEATWSNCPERDVHRAPDRPVSSYSSVLSLGTRHVGGEAGTTISICLWPWKEPKQKLSKWFQSIIVLLSRVWVFATPWTATRQTSLSLTISQSLFKFMSVELVIMMSIESSQYQIH